MTAKQRRKHKDAARRKEKYTELINAGFNSKQANRFKDYSDAKIDSLIKEKRLSNMRIKELAGDL